MAKARLDSSLKGGSGRFQTSIRKPGSLWSVHRATRRRQKCSRQGSIVTRTRAFRSLSVLDDASNVITDSKQLRFDFRTYPPCFQSRSDFNGWRALALVARPHSGICTDCLPEYHKKMLEKNRCDHPEVTFKQTKDSGIEGFLPQKGKKYDPV